MRGEGKPTAGEAETILGVAFDADQLGLEYAERRAWQMLMERLEPAELCGTALYDGIVMQPSGKRVLIIAVSGPRAAIQYVRDAFTAPDLLVFAGMLPIAQRIIRGGDLPRERLELAAYVDERGALMIVNRERELESIASSKRWPISSGSRPLPPQLVASASHAYGGQERETTIALRATKIDGATEMQLRIWRPSYRSRLPDRRRILFATVGTILILASLAILGSRWLVNHSLARGIVTPTASTTKVPATTNDAPVPIMVVAPLAIILPCTVGKTVQFVISNSGAAPLSWSSNAALFAPRLAVSAINGTVQPGGSLAVQVALGETVKTSQTITLMIQSNGGITQIALTIGPC